MSLEASELTALGSVLTGAGAPPPSSGVTSWNGLTGAVAYAPVITRANVAALAALPTAGPVAAGGYADGQQAFVASNKKTYVLQAAVSSAPDSNYVVATSDDPTRQWVLINLLDQTSVLTFVTAEIDFTVAPQVVQIVLPIAGYVFIPAVAPRVILTANGGAYTSGPTLTAGNNGARNNQVTSGSNLTNAFASGPVSAGAGAANLQNIPVNGPYLDQATPIDVSITVAAAGTGAFVCRGKVSISGVFVKL